MQLYTRVIQFSLPLRLQSNSFLENFNPHKLAPSCTPQFGENAILILIALRGAVRIKLRRLEFGQLD